MTELHADLAQALCALSVLGYAAILARRVPQQMAREVRWQPGAFLLSFGALLPAVACSALLGDFLTAAYLRPISEAQFLKTLFLSIGASVFFWYALWRLFRWMRMHPDAL